jgi:hypothetical protein
MTRNKDSVFMAGVLYSRSGRTLNIETVKRGRSIGLSIENASSNPHHAKGNRPDRDIAEPLGKGLGKRKNKRKKKTVQKSLLRQ